MLPPAQKQALELLGGIKNSWVPITNLSAPIDMIRNTLTESDLRLEVYQGEARLSVRGKP
jgi:hypothetical protein